MHTWVCSWELDRSQDLVAESGLGLTTAGVFTCCMVSEGVTGEGQGLCLMCVCVWLLYKLRGPLGWRTGGRGMSWTHCPRPTGQRGQKHGWLPTRPERWGGMCGCSSLPVCCAMASARGGKAVLCLAGLEWLRDLASGFWELGWGHPACMWLPSPILPGSYPPQE